MRNLLPIFVAIGLLAACASQPQRIADTASGWPEITINTVDKQAIKEAVINRLSMKGWGLEQEGGNSLYFTMVDSSGSMGSIMTQALIGNAYSTPPKYEARYILSEVGGKTKVVVNFLVSTQMAFGQVNRVSLQKNNSVFNAAQKQLMEIKKEIEDSKTDNLR